MFRFAAFYQSLACLASRLPLSIKGNRHEIDYLEFCFRCAFWLKYVEICDGSFFRWQLLSEGQCANRTPDNRMLVWSALAFLNCKIQFQQNSVSNSSFFILVMEVSGGEFLYDSGMCAPACLSSLGLSLQFSACEFRRKFCISGVFTVQDVCSAAGNGVVAWFGSHLKCKLHSGDLVSTNV